MDINLLKEYLDEKVSVYNNRTFIENDPISVPHAFNKKQDIEIAGFFAATLAWGQRTTIIRNSRRITELMDSDPHNFIVNHKDRDLIPFQNFVHRTFNSTDLLYFIHFLKHHYQKEESLETAFFREPRSETDCMQDALISFQQYFFSLEHPLRTHKHIASPGKNSACKRLNMYLRWMVRNDENKVDFGIWSKIKQSQLICPLDVHVARVANRLGLLDNTDSNWKNAVTLTNQLRIMNPSDPVIYDYALFSIDLEDKL